MSKTALKYACLVGAFMCTIAVLFNAVLGTNALMSDHFDLFFLNLFAVIVNLTLALNCFTNYLTLKWGLNSDCCGGCDNSCEEVIDPDVK